MRDRCKTGLLGLFRVKTAVFTGVLAGMLAVGACQGPPGTAGLNGKDGTDGTVVGSVDNQLALAT
ncbi:hypothetical protein FJ364_06010, partial [Candidatus Dependentiae bacterium]|nr:hypothetical protein [Candidatus Dependentiae bacterium]